jgi:hypothetical protein
MSYIRELRPYMYWLRYLTDAKEAGELDWESIGGTWGIATSRVAGWETEERIPTLELDLQRTLSEIKGSGAPNADLLARYVHKYSLDMWKHFRSVVEGLNHGGRAIYVVGNSSFYGHPVAMQEWYATLMREAGFREVSVTAIRKRNSKKELFEFAVEGTRG